MRTLVGVLFLFLTTHMAEAREPGEIVVQRAFRLEQGAFAAAYERHAFAQWLESTGARLTDAVRIHTTERSGRTEIRVDGLNVPDGNQYDMIFELTEGGRIADVRRLLIRERRGLSGEDQEVADFSERFVYVYDTDRATLLRDFLYPRAITLRYGGHSTTEASIGHLRQDFPAPFPVASISWERSEGRAVVTLSPAGVILTLDIPRYVASRGPDTYEKMKALRDSLERWSKSRPPLDPNSPQERQILAVSSERDAMIALREGVFRGYEVTLLDSIPWVIEASLPPFHGIVPAMIRYHFPVDTLTGCIQPRIEMDVQVGDSLVRWHGKESLPKPSISVADSVLQALLQDNVYRYRTLPLPKAFQPPLRAASSFEARLILHQKADDVFIFSDPPSYIHILRKLSEASFAYYVPRTIEVSSEGIRISGYAVWEKRSSASHHFARVQEVYVLEDVGTPRVAQVRMDLYPFIRTDTLSDLFAAPEKPRPGKQRFQIELR
jgi:hypothetical protein